MTILFLFLSVFVAYIILTNIPDTTAKDFIQIFHETNIKNIAAGVYLKNRIYDTIFEVIIFSLAVLGISKYHASEETEVTEVKEKAFKYISKIVAFFALVIPTFLSFYGHLLPGGGFALGVASGTALVLFGMSVGIERFEREYERLGVEILEKGMLIVIIVIAILEFYFDFNPSSYESIFGGSVQIQNILIYLKVTFGIWIITYNFMKHRGMV